MTDRQRAVRFCCGVSLVLAVGIAAWAVATDYPLTRGLRVSRGSGYTALGFLFTSLSVTPLRRLGDRLAGNRPSGAAWIALRRASGMTAAWWAWAHATWTLTGYLDGAWPSVLHEPYLRAGLVTLVILSLLLITSFPRLVARLRIRLWRPLHVLTYATAFFLLQHLVLSPFAPRRRTIALFAALATVALLRVLPSRRVDRPRP